MLSDDERMALRETASQGNDIIGNHWKHSGKTGNYYENDEQIDPRVLEIIRLAVIMPLAVTGAVLWCDQKIVEKNTGRLCDGFVAPRQIPPGWNPYVGLVCVRADKEGRGQLLTFTSTSWGGKKALHTLIRPYMIRGGDFFPVISLGSHPRGDEYNTQDPVFKIEEKGWTARSHFAELLGEHVPQLEATPTGPRLAAPVTESAPTTFGRSRGIAAEYNPPTKPDSLPERIDYDPTDPDNIVF
jgi:hypothetical protein